MYCRLILRWWLPTYDQSQARPDGAVLEDPGMPSSHAMVRT